MSPKILHSPGFFKYGAVSPTLKNRPGFCDREPQNRGSGSPGTLLTVTNRFSRLVVPYPLGGSLSWDECWRKQERLVATLSGFFGLLALLLASIGLYGLMAYTVARRTNEIGIRMALGARARDALKLVMRETLLLVLLGAALGLGAAVATTRLISSLLFGLSATDPVTLMAAALLMIVVAAFAGYLPAHRAAKSIRWRRCGMNKLWSVEA